MEGEVGDQQSIESMDVFKRSYMDPILDEEQTRSATDQMNLMTRKGANPYEDMDFWSRF